MINDIKNAKKWLKTHDREYSEDKYSFYYKNEQLFVNSKYGVTISYQKLTQIEVLFGTVDGFFDCSNNKLTSLLGSPHKVTQYFSCEYNKLNSLSYGPSDVGGNYICSYNKIKSLTNCPQVVLSHFICEGNPITNISKFNTQFKELFFHNTIDYKKIIPILNNFYVEKEQNNNGKNLKYYECILEYEELQNIIPAFNLYKKLNNQLSNEKNNTNKTKI